MVLILKQSVDNLSRVALKMLAAAQFEIFRVKRVVHFSLSINGLNRLVIAWFIEKEVPEL